MVIDGMTIITISYIKKSLCVFFFCFATRLKLKQFFCLFGQTKRKLIAHQLNDIYYICSYTIYIYLLVPIQNIFRRINGPIIIIDQGNRLESDSFRCDKNVFHFAMDVQHFDYYSTLYDMCAWVIEGVRSGGMASLPLNSNNVDIVNVERAKKMIIKQIEEKKKRIK